MATAPTIIWKQYTSSVNSETITLLSLGIVSAGLWTWNKCIKVAVGGNDATNMKLWLADSVAVVNDSPVSLGNASRLWDFKTTVTTSFSGTSALFSGRGDLLSDTLATDFRSAPNNSLGAGESLGTVVAGNQSPAVFFSAKAATLAFDGEYSGFSLQLGYNFT